jgi:hypothetical protein
MKVQGQVNRTKAQLTPFRCLARRRRRPSLEVPNSPLEKIVEKRIKPVQLGTIMASNASASRVPCSKCTQSTISSLGV